LWPLVLNICDYNGRRLVIAGMPIQHRIIKSKIVEVWHGYTA
jgi:hypothetical protein